ncbi:MAG: HK97 family phage prohead protease [Gammaproteobacteria bacterium]|nr:HK97 family phage prohead protease [Gammaproteobacteria bacterium]
MSKGHKHNSIDQTLFRDASLAATGGDDRKIEISFSSEEPYRREHFFSEPWIEVLGHKSGEVDLGRLRNGATVHYNHSRRREDRIGAVLDAQIVAGKGRATIQLSNRSDIDDIWNDVRDGLLTNVSIGYKIHERVLTKSNDDGPDEYRVTSWEPVEISLVDIPADPTVGVGRSAGTVKPFLTQHRAADSAAPTSSYPGAITMRTEDNNTPTAAELSAQANQRVVDINDAFNGYLDNPEMRSLHQTCLNDSDCSINRARTLLLDEIGKKKSPSAVGPYQPGYDSRGVSTTQYQGPAVFRDVVTDALLLRSNVKLENPNNHVSDARSLSIVDIARSLLEQGGNSQKGYSASRIISRALSTSDFSNILANVGEKIVLDGFFNPERGTHRIWTGVASHRDFKPVSHVAASETPPLELINEGGEYKYGKLVDTGDSIALRTYGKILPFTRQAMINDDLNQLEESARAFGDSAVRLEADLAYGLLVANPTMYDSTALFDAGHNNVGTAAAPSVVSLGEARKLMRNQKGLNDESFLDPQPFALLVPTSLETAAEQLLSSIYDPAGTIQAANTPEFIRKLQLVADPRLDLDSTQKWYLTANPNTFPWVKRIYLDGQMEPFVEENTVFDRDELQIKCRHDFAVKAYMWQGTVRNAGA